MTVRRVLQHIAPFTPYTTSAEALACFAADPALNGAPVVDHDGAPLGLVVRGPLKTKLADKSGYEMFAHASVTLVMDSAPLIVEDDTPHFAASPRTERPASCLAWLSRAPSCSQSIPLPTVSA